MEILQKMNGWIFERTSELGSGDHALNSSRFSSRLSRPPVYQTSPEIPPSKGDEILQGCCILNSAQFHQRVHKSTPEETVAAKTSLLYRKIVRSHEGNVDDEPPGSMDDFPWSRLRFELMMMKVSV